MSSLFNPAYIKARLRAGIPPSELPRFFAVITAYNPQGKKISQEENTARTQRFKDILTGRKIQHFVVIGYSPDSSHEEPGFGIICDPETAYDLGNEQQQEAVFYVVDGEITLMSCGPEREAMPLGPWTKHSDD